MGSGNRAREVTLGGFAHEVLDSMSRRGDHDRRQAVEAAIARYLDDREQRPPGWSCLPLPDEVPATDGGTPPIVVALSGASFAAIRAEAEAQAVSLDAIVAHAVMYVWAVDRRARSAP